MSYLTGNCLLVTRVTTSFLVGTLIQACAIVMYPDYAPTNRQDTLMVIAVTIVVWFLNIWGSRAMPLIQNIIIAIHVFGFLTIIIVLWALAPRNTAKVTFTQFTNDGGWNSTGLSLVIGQISAIYGCICMCQLRIAASMHANLINRLRCGSTHV